MAVPSTEGSGVRYPANDGDLGRLAGALYSEGGMAIQ